MNDTELSAQNLTNIASSRGSFKEMGEFNKDIRATVRGEKTSHVLSGEEQSRASKIIRDVKRIENYMKNIGYVMSNNERKEYMSVIEALKNGEINEIPTELLNKIEDREENLEER